MKLLHFLGRFLIYISILIIIWIPIAGKYFISATNELTVESFFIFYIPLNLIPFVALVLATSIESLNKFKIILIGSIIIFSFNVLIIILQYKFMAITTELFLIYAIGRITIPIIVWFGFVYNDIVNFNDISVKSKI